MCRSIKLLRVPDHPATDDELTGAALQFIRKISGFRKPSRANQAAFDSAVAEVAASSRRLLEHLQGDPSSARRQSVRTGTLQSP
jgi:hypothetical protein